MANSRLAGLVRTPPRSADSLTRARERPPALRELAFVRDQPFSSGLVPPSFLRRIAGPAVGILAIAAVCARQWISNVSLASPMTDAEGALGTNAYAFLNFPELRLPGSISEVFVSWQVAGYSFVTSATDRHDTFVGPTREFVLVVTVLTAVLMVAICRWLFLSWNSSALAVVLLGIPGIAVLVRVLAAPAALAAFWLVVAALLALIVHNRRGRRSAARQERTSLRTGALTWLLIALACAAAAMAVLSSGVSALVLLGLAFGFLSGRPLDQKWTPGLRGTTILSLCAALVGVSWVTVWGPSVGGTAIPSIEGAGAAVALGVLVLAQVYSWIFWLRPLALAAAPILLAAAWPGPAQAASLLLGLTVAAVLAAGLLDTVVGEGRSNFLSHRRPSPAWLAGAALLVASVAGALLMPSTAPAAATPAPDAQIAAWIETQLSPDAIVEVDPLTLVHLVRDGLDPARLRTAGQDGGDPEFVLVSLEDRTELPLLASFGSGPDALGVRLIVADPAAFTQAQANDVAARSRFGIALASNPNLSLGDPAVAALRAGEVDSRLMISLAAASASARLAIAEFTGTPGDLENGNVFRTVTLTEITDLDPTVGATGTSDASLRWLAQFFQTQQPPYQPLFVVEAARSLTVGYAAPSPLGLLP